MKKVKQTTEKKQGTLSLDKFKVASLDDFSKRKIQGGDEPITTGGPDDGDDTVTGAVIDGGGTGSTNHCK